MNIEIIGKSKIGKSKGLPNNPNDIILGSPGGGISIAAKIEDPIFNSAKSMFLRYAKQQHKPIIDIAKQELKNIKNNTYSACENNDLESFRIFPKKVQIAVLVSIITEFDYKVQNKERGRI